MKQSILVEGWEFHTSVVPIPVCPCIPYTLSNSPCPVWLLAQPSWIKFRSGSTVNIAWKSNLTPRSHWAALTNGYSSQLHAILLKHETLVWIVSDISQPIRFRLICELFGSQYQFLCQNHVPWNMSGKRPWTGQRSFRLLLEQKGASNWLHEQKAYRRPQTQIHTGIIHRKIHALYIQFFSKRSGIDKIRFVCHVSLLLLPKTVWSHWRCSYILRCTRVKGWRLVEVLTWAVSYGRVRTSVTLQKLHVHCTFLLWTYAVMTFQVWKWVSEFQNFWLGRPAHKVRHARDSVCGTRMISRTLQKRATCF